MNNHQLNGLRLNLTVMNTLVLMGLSIFIAVLFYMTSQFSRESEINNMMEAYCAQLTGEADRVFENEEKKKHPSHNCANHGGGLLNATQTKKANRNLF